MHVVYAIRSQVSRNISGTVLYVHNNPAWVNAAMRRVQAQMRTVVVQNSLRGNISSSLDIAKFVAPQCQFRLACRPDISRPNTTRELW